MRELTGVGGILTDSSKRTKSRRVEFVLYNIPTKTGSVANRPYITLLENITVDHCMRYYRGQFRVGKFREDYVRVPDGYKTKVFIKTVFVRTKSGGKDEVKFFDSLDY